MESPSPSLDERISRFWDRYLTLLDKNGVEPSAARWYVVRVEAYRRARKDRKFLDHRADDVVSYLQAPRTGTGLFDASEWVRIMTATPQAVRLRQNCTPAA